ncbi:MAG TPA: hypothetical protein DGG95_04595, partial [Cytophagales bacterium]|nr:hypothetical protein [Cytophagales bacterium]
MSNKQKNKSVSIIFLMIMQAALDFLNIGAFLPLFGLLAKPDFISSLVWLPFDLANRPPQQLAVIFSAGIIFFTVIKTVIVWFITQTKARFAYQIAHDISLRILNEGLSMDYQTLTSTDYSAEMDRIANKPLAFANNIVIGLTSLIAEGLIGLLILVALTIFNFRLLISLLLVVTPVALIYFLNRNRIKVISNTIKIKYPQTLKYALQAMEGWMEVKTYQKENYFSAHFKTTSRDLANAFAEDHVVQVFTSRISELFASLIICVIVFWTVFTNNVYEETMIILAVYVGASFRLLPSVNRILNAIIQIKSHEYLIDELASRNPANNFGKRAEALSFVKDISLASVSFSYPDRPSLFEGVNFRINKGEKVALVGKSGGGKTSMLLLLLGIVKPTKGTIWLDDKQIQQLGTGYQSLFSHVSQSPYVLDGSLKENVAFGIEPKDIDQKKVMECLREVNLSSFTEQLPLGLETQIGERGIMLSGGQR